MEISIEYNDENLFEAYIDGKLVAELELYYDYDEMTDGDEKYWLCGIYNKDITVKRKGIATKLMQAAVKTFGIIYVSKATDIEHKNNGDLSSRELTTDGVKFITSCVKKGIIKPEWWINPFMPEEEEDYDY